MNKTNDFKFNLPAYSDPVDVADLNDNFIGIDDALMAGLCKKEYTGNNMGSSDPSARKYAWAPWFEIVNDNEFDVVVTDRNAPVESEEATINIVAGQTFRKYINGRYYMNFYVQDQHDVTFKWFTNAETYINESGGGGGGTGTVTSVSVQGGSGSHLTASGNPIETSGTITINIDEGYSIPQTLKQEAWDVKAADLKAEIDSSTYVLTLQLKDSSGNLIGNERTIDLPLETMVVDGEYDPQTKKIKLELKNGNYVEFSVADLVSGLQTELNSSNKLNPEYIAYDASHRAVSDTEKGTWDSKQNALTFDDTPTQNSNNPVKSDGVYSELAGKQASLDQTQLAAVNSGIDQTKVAQISTNQTNILYSLNTGVRNLMAFTLDDAIEATEQEQSGYPWRGNTFYYSSDSSHTVSFTVNDDYSITVNGSTTSAYNFMFFKIAKMSNFKNCVGAAYINNRFVTNSDGLHFVLRGDGSTSNIVLDSGTDVPNDLTNYSKGLTIRIDANKSFDNVRIYPLVSPKTAFEADNTYKAPVLPNSDLTYLEAEDRAALAEEIDAGAKNILKINQASSASAPCFTSDLANTVTINGTIASGGEAFDLNRINNSLVLPAGTYVISTPDDMSNLGFRYYERVGGTLQNQSSERGAKFLIFTVSGSATENWCRLESNVGTTFSNRKVRLMICTKAAFGVSKAFVPYRLPLSDNTWIKSADLFPSHRTEFDVNNSHVYTYTNKFLNKIVVSIELKAATAISSASGVLSIASNIANIPPKTVFYDINELTNNFECCILKNNANGSLAFKVTTGTMTSGTTFNTQFEYTYGLN